MAVKKSVLFILPYPLGRAPSQRFRVEQFLPVLEHEGISFKLAPFMNDRIWNVLYKGGSAFQKAFGITKGFLKRWKTVLFDVPACDQVFIHREAAPLGPPVFEWIIAKVWKKKIIYDFDDAIWIPNISGENKIVSSFKAFWKVPKIISWSSVVTAGNRFLAEFSQLHKAEKVLILPTVVDTVNRYVPDRKTMPKEILTVGWTGSHSTLKYLKEIVPVLQELQKEIDFNVAVIADKDPKLPLKNYRFVAWNANSEIEDLKKIDIGVMPLTEDKWSEGKCGFKLIQYMSLGIPAVASPVGVNKEIVEDGVNSFLCKTKAEWTAALKTLLLNVTIRENFAEKAIETIENEFSLHKAIDIFLESLRK